MVLLFSTASSARLFGVLSVRTRLTRRTTSLRAHLALTAVTHETPRRPSIGDGQAVLISDNTSSSRPQNNGRDDPALPSPSVLPGHPVRCLVSSASSYTAPPRSAAAVLHWQLSHSTPESTVCVRIECVLSKTWLSETCRPVGSPPGMPPARPAMR